jgi:uncharacterized protein YoxC
MSFKNPIQALAAAADATLEQTIAAIQTTMTDTLNGAQAIAATAAEQGSQAIAQGLTYANDLSTSTQRSLSDATSASLAALQETQNTVQTATQAGMTHLETTMNDWQKTVAELATAGMVTTQALKDLPRTAQELAQEMPKLAQRMQQAGMRLGDAPRSDADIMALFNKIPGTSKLEANERTLRIFLSDKHGSHIHPHSQGGSNGAENIVWELGSDNIRRGAAVMTGSEQLYIRVYNAVDSVLKNSVTLAKLGLAATGTAVVTQAIVTALSHLLDLHRGDITIEEFRDRVVAAAVSAGIATPIFFLLFMAVIALFPEVVVVLSAPAVVAGFNALFGISITLPIVQSLLRHSAAGGFGEETQRSYEEAIAQGHALMQATSQELQQCWHGWGFSVGAVEVS